VSKRNNYLERLHQRREEASSAAEPVAKSPAEMTDAELAAELERAREEARRARMVELYERQKQSAVPTASVSKMRPNIFAKNRRPPYR
jgi:hypothetical protein